MGDNDQQIVCESIEVAPEGRAELVLVPDVPVLNPRLFMSPKGAEIKIESIFHGPSDLLRCDGVPLEHFRFGITLGITASHEEPIKIVFTNQGTLPTLVGASLVGRATSTEKEG